MGILKLLIEAMAECPANGSRRNDEVPGLVRAGYAVGWRWWKAGRCWWWLEVGYVVPIGPGVRSLVM